MEDRPQAVIALVGSAGALAAISAVLSGLPGDLRACVLVVVHQTPDAPSRLSAVLDRCGALPAVTASSGRALAAGEVQVAPNGCHMLVTPDDRVALIASGPFPPNRPSADLLLTTLATACGERAVAVVLSGNGHDGATGAAAVHTLGGTVVVSDETTSEVFAMPAAVIARDHIVDHICPVDAIAPLLVSLVEQRHSGASAP